METSVMINTTTLEDQLKSETGIHNAISPITSNYQNLVGGPLSPFIYRDDDHASLSGESFNDLMRGRTSESGPWMQLSDVLKFLNIYYTLFIIIVGLLGNTASLAVFLGTHLRSRSSSYYLAAVSLADSGFLLCLLSVWFTYLDINIYNRQGGCQIIVYLTYVFSFASVWLIVAFTLERFIAICFPFDRPSVCTIRRAKTNIALVAVGGIVFYSFVLITAGIVHPNSMPPPDEAKVTSREQEFQFGGSDLFTESKLNNSKSLEVYLLDKLNSRHSLHYDSDKTRSLLYNYNNFKSLKIKRSLSHSTLNLNLAKLKFMNNEILTLNNNIRFKRQKRDEIKITTSTQSVITDEDHSTEANNAGAKVKKEPECAVKPQYLNSMNIFNHIDTFITLFIPFGILILLNVLICRKIVLFKRDYYRNRKSENEYRDSNSTLANNNSNGRTSTAFLGSVPAHQTAITRNGAIRLCSFDMNGQRGTYSDRKAPVHAHIKNLQCKHASHSFTNHSPRQGWLPPKESCRSSTSTTEAVNSTPQPSCSNKNFTQRKSLLIRHHYNNNIFAKTQMSITKLLLIISTVFLVLNFPSYILRMRVYIMNLAAKDYENSEKYQMLENLFQLLYYTNFSINFLLYSVCGTNFRRALMRLFKNRCKAFAENSHQVQR